MSREQYPGSIISATPPTVTGPTDGEGGSAPGIWTIDQIGGYIANNQWPKPILAGGLWVSGQNQRGQLGLGNTTNYSSPKQVGSGTNWWNISGGTYFTIAVKSDGTLWGWGFNNNGQLGLSNLTYYSSPKQVGALTNWYASYAMNENTIALKSNGTLWGWGRNVNGELGLGNRASYSSPKQIGNLTTWSSVAATSASVLAIRTDGTLWSWGLNQYGELGLNNRTYYSSPKQVGTLTNWSGIGGGNSHVLSVKTDGTLWSWGYNPYGQLGQGNTTYLSSPKQVGSLTNWSATKIGTSKFSSMNIKTDGTLWVWGLNNFGQLGTGSTTSPNSPVQVGALTNWSRTGRFFSALFSMAVKTDGTLWVTGVNSNGQLGLNNTTNYSSPKQLGNLTTWLKVAGGYETSMATKN